LRHAKRDEGGCDEPLNIGSGEALVLSRHRGPPAKARRAQIREPA
jgi:hypothetical protein